MSNLDSSSKNRITAGRLNRSKRGALTQEGVLRLREAALRNRPWVAAAASRRKRSENAVTARELAMIMVDTRDAIRRSAELRRGLLAPAPEPLDSGAPSSC